MEAPKPDAASLCTRCRHLRLVRTRRSVFLLCQRSKDDARYERYPRQPVLLCAGHEPVQGETPPGQPPERGSKG